MNKEKAILFDGTNLDNWYDTETGEAPDWIVEDGAMTVNHHCIASEYEYGDAHIHVEFRTPNMPEAEGQWKGNSGVYVHGCYEIQVLDSYGVEPVKIDDCGSLYSLHTALCNACLPPMTWQTYDIIIAAPRFNQYGEIIEHSRMTVLLNGVVIHNNVVLTSATPGGITGDKRVARGRLMLQDHGNPVSFRNIWIMPLD